MRIWSASCVAAVLVAGLASAMPASAASVVTGEVYEVHHVRTAHDAVIRVEVWRDRRFDCARQPGS